MGTVRLLTDASRSRSSNQLQACITADTFDKHTIVSPGILKRKSNSQVPNSLRPKGFITNGCRIIVPENTSAFIFSQMEIENVLTISGEYEYYDDDTEINLDNDASRSVRHLIKDRTGYDGKKIAFVNLKEIPDIKFGTRGPQGYHDLFYNCDLEIYAYGSYTIQITDPELFIRYFIPPNTSSYSVDEENVHDELLSDFLPSFAAALSPMTKFCRIEQLSSYGVELSNEISSNPIYAGTWEEKYGFRVKNVIIENIEFTQQSEEMVKQHHESQDIPFNSQQQMSINEQIETVKKLKELVDAGILTEDEFNIKKKEIMGL